MSKTKILLLAEAQVFTILYMNTVGAEVSFKDH